VNGTALGLVIMSFAIRLGGLLGVLKGVGEAGGYKGKFLEQASKRIRTNEGECVYACLKK